MHRSPALVPALENYNKSLFLEESTSQRCCRQWSCGRIVGTTLSIGLFATIAGLYAADLGACRSQITSRSIIELGMGSIACWTVASLLTPQLSDRLKSFISDYATARFLILSQIYNNLDSHTKGAARRLLFGWLNIDGGAVLASYLHTLFNWKLGAGLEVPLVEEQDDGLESMVLSSSPLKTHLGSTLGRTFWALMTLGIGAGAVSIGYTVKQAELFQDFGMLLIGSAIARILNEVWWSQVNTCFNRNQQDESHNQRSHHFSMHVRCYQKLNRIILIVFHALPGALMVASAETYQVSKALSSSLFVLTGLITGWNEELRKIRFNEVPQHDLHELPPQDFDAEVPTVCQTIKDTLLPPKGCFQRVKWLIGVPGVLTFCGLVLAGYDPSTNSTHPIGPYVAATTTSFVLGLYLTYIAAERTRVLFNADRDRKNVNTAYYWLHYSLGVPLIFLYMMEKIKINDKAIQQYEAFAGIITSFAWGSLGMKLAKEASSRFNSARPRLVSSLYFALYGKFFTNLILS